VSIEAIAYIKSRDLGAADSAQARLLLYVIAENTFNDSFVCRLSRDQIAYEAGRVSERTVRRHISDLIEARVLIRRENYAAKGGRDIDDLRIVGFKKWYLANHRKNRQSIPDKLSGKGGGHGGQSVRAYRTNGVGHTGQQVSGIYKDNRTSTPVLSEEARERADDLGFEGKAARDHLRQMLGDEVYVAWFQGMGFAFADDGRVTARAANAFKAKWIAQNYERPLLDACRKVNASVTSVAVTGPHAAKAAPPPAKPVADRTRAVLADAAGRAVGVASGPAAEPSEVSP
jgi:hypothetical protein